MINNLIKFFKYFFILIILGGWFMIYASTTDGTIDINYKTSLLCLNDSCSSTSQINFLTTRGDPVHITDGSITGYAWSETMGWINLAPTNSGITNTSSGVLGGYAWGENAGWINFSPTNGGVTINNQGEFDGFAWAENYGWVKFDCEVTNACIKTDWRPASARDSGGNSGGGSHGGSFGAGGGDSDASDGVGDICPNIVGAQTLIPSGLVIDGAHNCVSPQQCNIINGALKQPLDVMIVIDKSGSMSGTKIIQAKNAANAFIDNLIPGSDRVGYVNYSTSATLVNKLTTSMFSVKTSINTTVVSGNTNIGAAVKTAYQELKNNARPDVKHVVILLTDGEANISDIKGQTANQYAISQSNIAKIDGTIIYTIGLGTSIDVNLLKQVSNLPTNYYSSPTGLDLSSIYLKIAAIECTAAPSKILDKVIYDKNNNGKSDTGDTGFSGVTVTLISKDGSQPDRTTESNSDGTFTFGMVTPGEYSVCATTPAGMNQTFPSSSNCYEIKIIQGIDVLGVTFLISGIRNEIPIVLSPDTVIPSLDTNIDINNDGLTDVAEVNNYESDSNDSNYPNDLELPSKVYKNSDIFTDSNFINILKNIDDGVFSFFRNDIFKLLEFKEGGLYDTRLFLDKFFKDELGRLTSGFITTIGSIIGIYAGIISVSFASPISFSELYFLPMRLWNLLLLALGFTKRNRPWGTVYDSTTKQPLDPAYVVLQDLDGKEVATSITDLDGRYGFLVPAGRYKIIVSKTNYKFPSDKLKDRIQDELYQDLYFNEVIEVKEGEVITKNIPMDSIKFDWNEFAKKDQKLMKFFSRRQLWATRISNFLFVFGFFVSLVSIIVSPVLFNIIIFTIYIVVFIFKNIVLKKRAIGYIRKKINHTPLSFAILRFFFNGTEQEVSHKVADKIGRYYCLIPNGVYFVKIENKNIDESYSLVHTSEPIEVKNGHIDKNFDI